MGAQGYGWTGWGEGEGAEGEGWVVGGWVREAGRRAGLDGALALVVGLPVPGAVVGFEDLPCMHSLTYLHVVHC